LPRQGFVGTGGRGRGGAVSVSVTVTATVTVTVTVAAGQRGSNRGGKQIQRRPGGLARRCNRRSRSGSTRPRLGVQGQEHATQMDHAAGHGGRSSTQPAVIPHQPAATSQGHHTAPTRCNFTPVDSPRETPHLTFDGGQRGEGVTAVFRRCGIDGFSCHCPEFSELNTRVFSRPNPPPLPPCNDQGLRSATG